jgi:hypothetical protein
MLQPKLNPKSCHFSCVQIEIDLCSVRNTGAERELEMTFSLRLVNARDQQLPVPGPPIR